MAITEQEILDSLKAICEKRADGKTKGATFELMKLSCDLDWLVGFILEEINLHMALPKRMVCNGIFDRGRDIE